jgi:hypothetical protein
VRMSLSTGSKYVHANRGEMGFGSKASRRSYKNFFFFFCWSFSSDSSRALIYATLSITAEVSDWNTALFNLKNVFDSSVD